MTKSLTKSATMLYIYNIEPEYHNMAQPIIEQTSNYQSALDDRRDRVISKLEKLGIKKSEIHSIMTIDEFLEER